MEQIIVGFSKSTKKFAWFSWLIRWIDKTEYSHVYIKFYSKSLERDIIYQASGSQVNFVGTKIFLTHNKIISEYSINIDSEIRKKMIQKAIDNSGIPYGIKEVLGLGLVRFSSIFGKKIQNPFRDGANTFVCVELIAQDLKEAGLLNIEDTESITPRDLEPLIKELNNG